MSNKIEIDTILRDIFKGYASTKDYELIYKGSDIIVVDLDCLQDTYKTDVKDMIKCVINDYMYMEDMSQHENEKDCLDFYRKNIAVLNSYLNIDMKVGSIVSLIDDFYIYDADGMEYRTIVQRKTKLEILKNIGGNNYVLYSEGYEEAMILNRSMFSTIK